MVGGRWRQMRLCMCRLHRFSGREILIVLAMYVPPPRMVARGSSPNLLFFRIVFDRRLARG